MRKCGIGGLIDQRRQVPGADEIRLGQWNGGALVPDDLARGDRGKADQHMHPVLYLGPFDMQRHAFARQVRRDRRAARAVDVDMRKLCQKPRNGIGQRPAGKSPDALRQATKPDDKGQPRRLGHRSTRLIRSADAQRGFNALTFVAQPVLEGLVDDVDAFQKLSPRLKRAGGRVAVLIKIGRDTGQAHRVAVGFKAVGLTVQGLANFHQGLTQAAAGLLGPPV